MADICTRAATDEYREGWERMWGKKAREANTITPAEMGVAIDQLLKDSMRQCLDAIGEPFGHVSEMTIYDPAGALDHLTNEPQIDHVVGSGQKEDQEDIQDEADTETADIR